MRSVPARARSFGWFRFIGALALLSFSYHSAAHADLWGATSDTPGTFNRVVRFDPVTGDALSGGIPEGTAGLARPIGIATGPDGKLYVASRGNDAEITPKIQTFTCDTAGVCSGPTLFADFTVGADPTQPSNMRFGPDGNLYVSELFFVGGDDVRVYNPSGTRLANGATGIFPTAVSFDSSNNLLAGTPAGGGFPATILRFTGGSPSLPLYIDDPMAPQLGVVGSMLLQQNGDVLAVDTFGGRIVRITPAGELSHFAFIPESIPNAPTFPSDIVFDPDGNLIVSVLGPTNGGEPGGVQGQLLRYDLQGGLIEVMLEEFEPIAALAWTNSPLTIVGNYDGIGGVDEDDFAKWQGDFGKWVAPGNGADGNGDGVVNTADFVVWRKFASVAGAGGSASVDGGVPEPSSAVLALFGLMAGMTRFGRSLRASRR